jgi:hypothetical protein
MSLHTNKMSKILRKIIIDNLYVPNVGVPKFIKHILLYWKAYIDHQDRDSGRFQYYNISNR